MPTIELLRKYHLMQFAEVTKAVRYLTFSTWALLKYDIS